MRASFALVSALLATSLACGGLFVSAADRAMLASVLGDVSPAQAAPLFIMGGAEMGLVNKCVPATDVLATTQAMAREMAEVDPIVLRHAKAALYYGGSHSMAEAMKNEQRQSAILKAERDAAKAGQ